MSVGVETLPNSIFLSATSNVDELTVVVVPFTVKLPDNVRLTAVAFPVSAGAAKGAKLPSTYAVVAICVLFVLAAAVGAAGVPTNVGLSLVA